MKRFVFLLIFVCTGVFLASCDSNDKDEQNNATTVDEQIGKVLYENGDQTIELAASEKNLPAKFEDLALEREEVPHFQYLIKKADTQSEYEDAWGFYELDGKAPNIDFDSENAYFIGMYESGEGDGNCPAIIKDIQLDRDAKAMKVFIVELIGPNDGCDEMATPRTHVVKANKDISQGIESITMVEEYINNPIETEVPVGN
ncbi:hypothetical protein JNUCC1_01582 [Lentibacillus sp. JNUCC-1]|uniref:hypothetical protein n=1 Tax=Lentibacillus sp. JNUCC-1 TaxID=2654513 RepID=UPI0012E88C43|nr:hypothetical protein [Lentibacillus sp. JNUCC-1]MUV37776.1 hypothetical protein [Lentibacillus sp. JNUCC-1]